jgi:predicted nucleic acid-binding protein
MTALVLDCSVAIAWVFEDEANPATDALLDRVGRDGALVPAIWRLEVANVLIQAERRKRIAAADVTSTLSLLARLPIEDAAPAADRRLGALIDLARRHDLTCYDAAYLDLAVSRALPLATRDKALARAARDEGILVLPE